MIFLNSESDFIKINSPFNVPMSMKLCTPPII